MFPSHPSSCTVLVTFTPQMKFKLVMDQTGWHCWSLLSFQDIENNEAQRKELQRLIDEAIDTDHNKTFLRILRQYRLLVRLLLHAQCQYQASPEPSKSIVGSEVSSSMPPEAGIVVPMV